MLIIALKWVLVIIMVEAVTEIIISSEIFLGIRNWFAKRSSFFQKLLSCGYCFSVWVAASVAWVLPGDVTTYPYLDIIIKIFVVHRLSNVLHELFKRLFNRLPWSIVFNKVDSVYDGGDIKPPEGGKDGYP